MRPLLAALFALPLCALAASQDFNGDGKSDLILGKADGSTIQVWYMDGNTVLNAVTVWSLAGWKVDYTADFNGDGKADLLLRKSSNASLVMWINGVGASPLWRDLHWYVAGTGDFNQDGRADVLYRKDDGKSARLLFGANARDKSLIRSLQAFTLPSWVDASWKIAGVADFNADGRADILWQKINLSDTRLTLTSATLPLGNSGTTFAFIGGSGTREILGVADFNNDGTPDIVDRKTDGSDTQAHLMLAGQISSNVTLPSTAGWNITAIADFNGDGKPDLIQQKNDGSAQRLWLMNGTNISSQPSLSISNDWLPASQTGGNIDTLTPTIPAGLTATATSTNRILLSWAASTDNIGVSKYRLYRNNQTTALAEPTTNSYADTSVSADTAYTYQIRAVDAAGNASALSTAASTRTPAAPLRYSLGATVTGLNSGKTLVLGNRNGDTLSFTQNTHDTFPTQLVSGASYFVSIKAQPTGQYCAVSNAGGAISSNSLTVLSVKCITPTATPGLLFPDGIEPGDAASCEAPAGKRCWWVDATAANGGNGTFASPYNSFETLENNVQGSDFVYVRGTFSMANNTPTHKMSLNFHTLAASGTAEAPTTLKSWRGFARAVFDSNRTDAQIRMTNTGGVRLQNLEITNFGDVGISVDEGVRYADLVSIVARNGRVTETTGVGGGIRLYAQDAIHTLIVRNSLFEDTSAADQASGNVGALSLISEPSDVTTGSTFTVYNNVFRRNYVAIRHKHAGNIHMEAYNNLIENNAWGLHLRTWSSNIHDNWIIGNQVGVVLENSNPHGNHDYQLHHNTFYNNDYLLEAKPDWPEFTVHTAMHIEDNIFVGTPTALGVFYIGEFNWNWGQLNRSLPTWTMNNNVFYYTPAGRPFLYSPPPTAATYTKSFAEAKALFGDTSSIYADPLFTDPQQGDFSLQSGSPAINAGSNGSTPGVRP